MKITDKAGIGGLGLDVTDKRYLDIIVVVRSGEDGDCKIESDLVCFRQDVAMEKGKITKQEKNYIMMSAEKVDMSSVGEVNPASKNSTSDKSL